MKKKIGGYQAISTGGSAPRVNATEEAAQAAGRSNGAGCIGTKGYMVVTACAPRSGLKQKTKTP